MGVLSKLTSYCFCLPVEEDSPHHPYATDSRTDLHRSLRRSAQAKHREDLSKSCEAVEPYTDDPFTDFCAQKEALRSACSNEGNEKLSRDDFRLFVDQGPQMYRIDDPANSYEPADPNVDNFIRILQQTQIAGPELRRDLLNAIHETRWIESLLGGILKKLTAIIKQGKHMNKAFQDAVDKSTKRAHEFEKDNPYWTMLIEAAVVIALGVLLILLGNWVIAALGFEGAGVRAGSWAARWMSQVAKRYGGVSKRSIYAFLQSLGARFG